MKIQARYKALQTLKADDPVTIRYRFNGQRKGHPGHEYQGTFAFLLDGGERIQLWEHDQSFSYRLIVSVTKG